MAETRTRRRRIPPLLAVVAVIAVAGGAVWFLQDRSPSAVSLDDAVASLGDEPDVTTAITDATGTWTVDTASGTFDFESATGSFVGFRVREELAGIGAATAVGRTGAVAGSVEIGPDSLVAAEITADLSRLTTNDSRRDNRVHGALGTREFPSATFVLTEAVSMGTAVASGEPVSVAAVGELTVKGVTRPVIFPLEAQIVGSTIVVVGSLDITFADFGVTVPSAPIVVSAEDHGVIELQLLLTRT